MGMGYGRYYSDANWDGAATLVTGSPVVIGSIFIDNENAAARFLQVFNANAVADVTLGTTEPQLNIRVPATDNRSVVLAVGADFDLGVVIALTTTTRGDTAGGTGNIFIEIR